MPPPPQTHPLHPLTAADLPATLTCHFPSFATDPLRLATFPPHLTSPTDPDEELRFRTARTLRRIGPAGGYVGFKILDPANPARIAAWASWKRPGSAETQEKGEGEAWPRCANREVLEETLRCTKEGRERVFGAGEERARFWYLEALCTDPEFQGRGMGAALVRWGMEQAEREGVPVYLEATPAGRPLYAKLGFEVVVQFDFSGLLPDGGDYVVACMIWRPGKKAQ